MDQVSWNSPEVINRERRTRNILILAIILICAIAALFYFSFLPSKPSGQKNKISPTPTPTSKEFRYDSAKATTLLTQYVKDTIKPNILPSGFNTEKGIVVAQQEKNPNIFTYSFSSRDASISAFFRYEKGSNTVNSFNISINFPTVPSAPDTVFANSLLSSYLNKPYIFSDCKHSPSFIFCENLQITSKDKKGYALTIFGKPPKSINIISTCSIPRESTSFMGAKSCIAFQ